LFLADLSVIPNPAMVSRPAPAEVGISINPSGMCTFEF
jgi:hypothetical protein